MDLLGRWPYGLEVTMRRFLVAAVTLVLVVTMASPATAARFPEPPAVCDPDPYPDDHLGCASTSTLDLDHHHTMTVIVSAVDGESPIQSVEAVFVSPHRILTVSGESGAPISGTTADGTWKVRVGLPHFSELGAWRLFTVGVFDARYSEDFNGGQFLIDPKMHGWPSVVHVTGTADLKAPVVT